jgi:hypothetical protein
MEVTKWLKPSDSVLRKSLRAAPDYVGAMFDLVLLLQRKNEFGDPEGPPLISPTA